MINPTVTIEKIKNALKAEIDSGSLKGTYSESDKTISLYVYKTETETDPLLTFRVTDHRPIMQKYIRPGAPRPSTQDNTNMSVEFYIPKYESDGTKKQNKFRNNVVSPKTIEEVKPFSISSFNYDSRILDQGDDDSILNSIIDWLHNSRGNYPYKDPFEYTPKAANVLTKTAKVKISSGEGGEPVTEIVHKSKIRITESQLKRIIQEVLIETIYGEQNDINEGKLGRALGAAALGGALMLGNPQPANAQLRNVRIQSEMPQQPQHPSGTITDNLSVEYYSENSPFYLVYRADKLPYRTTIDDPVCFCLGKNNAKQTLLDLEHLIEKQTPAIIVDDYSHFTKRFKISYYNEKDALKLEEYGHNGAICGCFYLDIPEIKKAIQYIDAQKQWEKKNEIWRKIYKAWEIGNIHDSKVLSNGVGWADNKKASWDKAYSHAIENVCPGGTDLFPKEQLKEYGIEIVDEQWREERIVDTIYYTCSIKIAVPLECLQ